MGDIRQIIMCAVRFLVFQRTQNRFLSIVVYAKCQKCFIVVISSNSQIVMFNKSHFLLISSGLKPQKYIIVPKAAKVYSEISLRFGMYNDIIRLKFENTFLNY